MSLLVCNQCASEGRETKIPYDDIGVALMHQHLKSHEPGYTPPPATPPTPTPPTPTLTPDLLEELAEISHNAYEEFATQAGWTTQLASRKPWSDVPEPNKATVRYSLQAVLARLGYTAPPPPESHPPRAPLPSHDRTTPLPTPE